MSRTIDLAPAVRGLTGRLDMISIARAERQIAEMSRAADSHHNYVQATLIHRDGSVDVLGVSTNVRTNDGADFMAGAMGGLLWTQGGPATAISATSVTGTGTPYVSNALKGARVVMPVTGLTTAPVYGNVVSNTTSVITLDQWWNASDTTGTTPASTSALLIPPGHGPGRFLGITTDAAAASSSDTSLASEITTNGGARALGLYAHTGSATTYTLSKTFAFSGSFTAIHKAGIFTALTGGLLLFETVMNADATVVSGDSMALTWTITNS